MVALLAALASRHEDYFAHGVKATSRALMTRASAATGRCDLKKASALVRSCMGPHLTHLSSCSRAACLSAYTSARARPCMHARDDKHVCVCTVAVQVRDPEACVSMD
eukprot:5809412-Pleurochrysis_carterae.AAC.1